MPEKADDIRMLLWKHLRKELSSEEELRLQEWVKLSPANRELLEELNDQEGLSKEFKEYHQLKEWFGNSREEKFKKLLPAKVVPTQRSKRTIVRLIAAASIILLLGTISIFLLTRYDKSGKETEKSVASNQSSDIKPGTYAAILKLADGKQIILDSAGLGLLAQQGKVNIINEDGAVKYDLQGKESHEIILNTLLTNTGQTYALTLSDGTKVKLNARSSLRFPAAFPSGERVVEMEGEVYFEVAKNDKVPFIVKINKPSGEKSEVEVLGTHFNVNAYDDESVIRTTLIEGRVKVSNPANDNTQILSPGQQSRQNNNGSIEVISGVNTDAITAWKDETFQFEGDDLPSIMRQLSRWYGVQVSYEGKMPDRRFSGMIGRNTNLSEVLDMLRLSKINFSVEGNKVTVKP